jgi:membrane-bound inhibitor of C-type lysozyme
MKRLLLLPMLSLAACTMTGPGKIPDSGAGSGNVRYVCDSGEAVYVNYRENGISLRYRGRTHRLKIAVSASGARYAGDGLIWWNKGAENTLYKLIGKDDIGDRLESCREPPRKR